ncbi:hypothetical protein ACWGR4_35585 [Embleya sp. NPDC055664]
MSTSRISRRNLFTGAAVIGAAIALPASGFLSAPAYAADDASSSSQHEQLSTGPTSRNGWEMEKVTDNRGHIYTRPVPGVPLAGVQVRIGDVEMVLVHVIRRFHYEIDQLGNGDVVGWRAPRSVRNDRPESNQASGTAVQIRPGHYPAGAQGGFFPLQLTVIRDVLAELDGVVRWGGDDRDVDEALFYIDVRPGDGRLAEVANRIRGWQDEAGKGAGAPVDVTSRTRRGAAEAMESRQRTPAA